MRKDLILLYLFLFFSLKGFSQTFFYCPGDSVHLGLASYTGNLQWQQSSDSLNWSDIAGATFQPYGLIFSNDTYYRARVTVPNCSPAFSIVLFAKQSQNCCSPSHYPEYAVHCNGIPTAVIEVTNPLTGKTWMDRNLGASRVAISDRDSLAYGDLYQWGRAADGHQCRNSPITTQIAGSDNVGHGSFIVSSSSPYHWSSALNQSLWQGINGMNNPCPKGFRIPTENELNEERATWITNDFNGAFLSPLKLTQAGFRTNDEGVTYDLFFGNYWTSTLEGQYAKVLSISNPISGNQFYQGDSNADGYSVRCIKDDSLGFSLLASVSSLNCDGAVNSGTLVNGIKAQQVSSTISYSGGNGCIHNGQTIASIGVNGLVANLEQGTIANGDGSLIYTITGVADTTGIAIFPIHFGGQTCSLQVEVVSRVFHPYLTYGSLTDQDGNTYKTIDIGTQTWMAENLKTTRYQNRDLINKVTDANQWYNTKSGAWAYPNIDSQYEATYGKLYNWYASTDYRNICPNGWHLPNEKDWDKLAVYLDSTYNPNVQNSISKITGVKLGSTSTLWQDNWLLAQRKNATNESGFSALPAGQIIISAPGPGAMLSQNETGTSASFWTSDFEISNAPPPDNFYVNPFYISIYDMIDNSNPNYPIYYPSYQKNKNNAGGVSANNGLSIRCIKDNVTDTVNVNRARINSIDCNNINLQGILTAGKIANGSSFSLIYSGGNGGYFTSLTIPSTGVSGLQAHLTSGKLSNGNDTIQFYITGTPNAEGLANFNIEFGGQNCTVSIPVNRSVFNTNMVYESVIDEDGNTYKTIKIGAQTWMAENLRTTRYQNREPLIGLINTTDRWPNPLEGAWVHYNYDIKNEYYHGKLYNYEAITDARKICPIGWKMPSMEDWQILSDYLGGENFAGGKLKSASSVFWNGPSIGATNESGFSALPGGRLYDNAGINDLNFAEKGDFVSWWTTSQDGNGYLLKTSLERTTSVLSTTQSWSGSFVRCLKEDISTINYTGTLNLMDCNSANLNGRLSVGISSENVTSTIAYSGGNGELHNPQNISSNGVTGLRAVLIADTLEMGNGTLTYKILGRPENPGTANFDLTVGGKTCTLALNVTDTGSIFNPNLNYGSITDLEGNTYKTIQIGTQTWMAENLKSTKYQNGQTINNTGEISPNGKTYDWYTASSEQNICPKGWHVPNDSDWFKLIVQLDSSFVPNSGYMQRLSRIAGGKMKSTGSQYWGNPNTDATNSSGFSALNDYYWSATSYDDLHGNYFRLEGFSGDIYSNFYYKTEKWPVRCLKNEVPSIGTITSIDCINTINKGILIKNYPTTNASSSILYMGGNGGLYEAQQINSTGVTGLTATLQADTFAYGSMSYGYGNDTLLFIINGTPDNSGFANFFINIGGQSCTLSIKVYELSECYPQGSVFCNGPTEIIDVINPFTGKMWMDRNLGANRVAQSSTDSLAYGDLYQWGRGSDGHQCRNSSITTVLSSSDQPGNREFIVSPISPNDWRSPQNSNLWQGISGVNNPCPSSYRIPTETELDNERLSWVQDPINDSNNSSGAFSSPLKLTLAGNRDYDNGLLNVVDVAGYYWSTTVGINNARLLSFDINGASVYSSIRVHGFSIRCIKD